MTTEAIITSLLIGAIAGALAGFIMNSHGGLIRNIIIGIVGGFVGTYVFGLLNISWEGIIGSIGTSLIGACILIFIGRLLFK